VRHLPRALQAQRLRAALLHGLRPAAAAGDGHPQVHPPHRQCFPLPRFGDGSTRRDYTYVTDIINGLMRAIERVQGFEIINLGGSQTTRLADLIDLLEKNMGRKAVMKKSRCSPAMSSPPTPTWTRRGVFCEYEPG